jgi:hypothetical protein
MNIYTPILAFLIPAFAPSICAQETKATPTKQFALPAGEIKVMDLIGQCAAYLDVNILTTASDCVSVQPIRLHKAITTDASGCEEVLTSLLSRSGFALTVVDEKHGLLEVLQVSGPRNHEILMRSQRKSVESILARPNLVVPVTTVLTLKYIHANAAHNSMRGLFARSSGSPTSLQVSTSGSTSTLIINGMQNEVAWAIRVIQRSDVKAAWDEQTKSLQSRLSDFAKRIKSLEKKLK